MTWGTTPRSAGVTNMVDKNWWDVCHHNEDGDLVLMYRVLDIDECTQLRLHRNIMTGGKFIVEVVENGVCLVSEEFPAADAEEALAGAPDVARNAMMVKYRAIGRAMHAMLNYFRNDEKPKNIL